MAVFANGLRSNSLSQQSVNGFHLFIFYKNFLKKCLNNPYLFSITTSCFSSFSKLIPFVRKNIWIIYFKYFSFINIHYNCRNPLKTFDLYFHKKNINIEIICILSTIILWCLHELEVDLLMLNSLKNQIYSNCNIVPRINN